MSKSTIIVRFDEDGRIQYYVSGQQVRLLIVDERTPHDRVYEWLPRHGDDVISDIIGTSHIGNGNDDRQKALIHHMECWENGERPIKLVE